MRLTSLFISFFCLSLCLFSCKAKETSSQKPSKEITSDDYSGDWLEVEKLEKKGMGKSIIEKVDVILEKAISENNVAQIFKAMAYRSRYSNAIEEESTLKILTAYQDQISKSETPLTELLHSSLAELYFQYYNQNRWRFNQRTNTADFDAEDLRTWSLSQILGKVQFHYLKSLENKEALSSFPTEAFQQIIYQQNIQDEKAKINVDLRPSLYDFLADRALGYFKQNEGRVDSPIDEFDADKYPLFTPISKFTSINFESQDSSSNELLTAQLFQEILELHQNDKDPSVLVNFTLMRLSHYFNTSNKEEKDSLFLKSLQSLSNQFSGEKVADEIDYRIAQLYSQWGHEYNSQLDNGPKRWYLKKAIDICKSKEGKSTFGAKQCLALLQNLQIPSFSFNAESVYLPDQPILYRFQYQNIDSVYFKLIKVPHGFKEEFNRGFDRNFFRSLSKNITIKSWKENLPNPEDFQQHSLELYTEGLEKGNYFLLASVDEDFNFTLDPSKEQIIAANLSVSELAYFSRRSENGKSVEVYVRHRENGTAIPNTKVVAYKRDYNRNSRQHEKEEIGQFITDKNGFVSFSRKELNREVLFSIYTKDDTIISDNSYYLNYRNRNSKLNTQTHYYADRAIYRPGQTVYFKGIVMESNQVTKRIRANYSTEVSLFNINGEKLNSISVTTNDYGSFQGSFVLPPSGLNGQYRIQSTYGNHYFSVEEYKRPTFKVELDTSKTQNRINELVKVSGLVQTFSGAFISDAIVKYRIVRKATYPHWSYFRSFYPPANQKEIANGNLKTNENGGFSFEFLAQADSKVKAEWNPVFNYEVTIDATNPNGETQSLTESIQLSQQSLFLSSTIDDAIQLNELKNLIISAKNINGKEVSAKVNLSLWKLKTPEQAKKKKLWAKVDQNQLSENEYRKSFPTYPVKEEMEINAFPRQTEISNSLIDANKKVNLFRDLKTGAYEIDATSTDKFGNEVNFKKRFVLFDEESDTPPYPVFSWLEELKAKGEPGENAEVLFASSLSNLKVLYEIELNGEIIKKEWLTISNSQKKLSVPIEESYRGGFVLHLTAVHSDRLIQHSQFITVPFSNKKLKVELGTFRNKVEPNSKEKWSLTISGQNGVAVDAEILASMYDQSLDQFIKKDWLLDLYRNNRQQLKWDFNQSFNSSSSRAYSNNRNIYTPIPEHHYPALNWFGFSMGYSGRGITMMAKSMSADGVMRYDNATDFEQEEITEETSLANSSISSKEKETEPKPKKMQQNPIRSDFRETVFFYPQLETDKEGKISFEFTMADALTEWKFRALAHSKDLKVGMLEQSIQTQKKLIVQPNAPRFFREGDEVIFKAIIYNQSEELQFGFARLEFFDVINGNKLDLFSGQSADPHFEIFTGKNTTVSWKIKVPPNFDAVKYRITARSDNFSDGEEKIIPILPNRMLVTESLPLWVRGNQKKEFNFEKLLNSAKEKTLTHENFTLEFTENPTWYAIQALPSLTENGQECSEQVFARLYANSLAEKIANSNPKIKAVFEQWKNLDSDELTSKLMQNQELKTILIEETPWLQKAKDETEQKRRIALLFDYNQMAMQKKEAIQRLSELQLPNGGWSWYKGMRDNRYITQYIVEGFGHLVRLGVDLKADKKLDQMLSKAISYLDARIEEDYNRLVSRKEDLSKDHLSHIAVHYLYTRSYFLDYSGSNNSKAFEYYVEQAEKYWLNRNLQQSGMIALSLKRFKPQNNTSQEIIASLKDNSLQNEEMGMYWKSNSGGYYWYQSAIETQALMIEAFAEVTNDFESVEELKIWLLKQKQTQAWSNSKATATACYALLMTGMDLLTTEADVEIKVGDQLIEADKKEAGTGYFKKVWKANEVKPELGKITINKKDDGIAWGGVYWQFYQDLDQISSATEGNLKLSKTLFKSVISDKGESMKPIDASDIKVGDKIKVRIRLEVDRNMEFVHLKDMRASTFEPINVISRYKYQDGLGYYESTKDASTNFFMDRLAKGVYVFEYELRASIAGEFSNGISSIQCQYAPEFSSHSKGRRVVVGE